MSEYQIRIGDQISRRKSQEMIFLFARHGNHFCDLNFKSDADLKHYLSSKGFEFENLVEHCRSFENPIPIFEKVEHPGSLVLLDYWAIFETAVEARNRAIEKVSYPEFLTAVSFGIASLESYINYRVELWNRSHVEAQRMDSKAIQISFDEKINTWLPSMADDREFDKNTVEWGHLNDLRNICNEAVIHPKTGFSLVHFAENINLFRSGIAGILIQLHLFFGDRIPSVIIRAAYTPDLEVVFD